MTNKKIIDEINSMYIMPTNAQIEKINKLTLKFETTIKPTISNTAILHKARINYIIEHWFD